MRRLLAISALGSVILLAASGFSQQPTIARLNHETTPDISRTTVSGSTLTTTTQRSSAVLKDSWLSRAGARAFFVNSNLVRARTLADQALRQHRGDAEALFVQMEAAGMQEDQAIKLESAITLCEVGNGFANDPRVRLAATRLRESAAKTSEFRKVLPRIQLLRASTSQRWPDLDAAVLHAAMDGVPGLNPYSIARSSGILTDWRIVRPAGHHVMTDFEQDQLSLDEDMAQSSYNSQPVENFQFPDGRILLPDYLPRRGTFYATAHFASLTASTWTAQAEGGGALQLYVDGRKVLRQTIRNTAARERPSASFDITAGPHRVLLKFVASASPVRISIFPTQADAPSPLPSKMSSQEAAYLLAVEHYASEEFGLAVKQIDTLPSGSDSAPLQWLRAQSLERSSSPLQDRAATWSRVITLAPGALAADDALARLSLQRGERSEATQLANRVLRAHPANVEALQTLTAAVTPRMNGASGTPDMKSVWTRLVAAHAACDVLQSAIAYFRANALISEADAAQQKLEDCAPESLDYAASLSQQGNHAGSAEALQRLVTAAPLNRGARLMLVRELQLAGDDAAAQHAAAEWLRIAPNAENYHRLAANDVGSSPETTHAQLQPEFYLPYRRAAVAVVRAHDGTQLDEKTTVLLDDHVAISRPDGSVSLYVHTVTRVSGQPDDKSVSAIPSGVQVLQARVIHADSSIDPMDPNAQLSVEAGDILEEEYVIHYVGDGGIPEHSEAFQFVFGSFGVPVQSARFVVLTPAEHADRGVVITTGDAPATTTHVQDGMLARVWQKDTPAETNGVPEESLAIVRIVEQENGWSVPSNAERQRRIETIHPGPRSQDS